MLYIYIYLDLLVVFSKIKLFYYMSGVHAWGEEGEEKHPPVGKDINRPQFPNHSPPLATQVRVTRCPRLHTSFSRGDARGDVILAW